MSRPLLTSSVARHKGKLAIAAMLNCSIVQLPALRVSLSIGPHCVDGTCSSVCGSTSIEHPPACKRTQSRRHLSCGPPLLAPNRLARARTGYTVQKTSETTKTDYKCHCSRGMIIERLRRPWSSRATRDIKLTPDASCSRYSAYPPGACSTAG